MIHVYGDLSGFDINSQAIEAISFYYNSKTHRYEVHLNYGSENKTFEVSKAKGEAIIEFLKWLSQESKELSSPGSEDSFDKVPNEDSFAEDLSEEIFDSQGEEEGDA